ncbi:MAG: GNAT family N-acetyltransferase [Bacillota bacterium]
MNSNIHVKLLDTEDVNRIAQIYMSTFPKYTKSLMGIKTCCAYFNAVQAHRSYKCLIATEASKPIGFVVLHLDRRKSMNKGWVYSSSYELFRFSITHTYFLLQRLFAVSISRIRHIVRQLQYSSKLPQPAYLDIIAIEEVARRKGVARHLLKECISLAKMEGLQELALTVGGWNQPAIRFYISLGFYLHFYDKENDTCIYKIAI